MTPLQRLHYEISQPSSSPFKAARKKEEPKPITLAKADVDAILRHKRNASPEELEWAIAHTRELRLTDYERNSLGVSLSIVIAQRSRGMNGRKEDPNLKFISETLGLAQTPFGLIERSFIEGVLREGARNIQRCRRHLPPCSCWSSQRAILMDATWTGEKTPEGWAASRMLDILEELELAPRAERADHYDGYSSQRATRTQDTFAPD